MAKKKGTTRRKKVASKPNNLTVWKGVVTKAWKDPAFKDRLVQDTNGVNYFVEFRNFTAEDAQYSGATCTANACVANASIAMPSIRSFFMSSPSGSFFRRIVDPLTDYGLPLRAASNSAPAGPIRRYFKFKASRL